MGFQGAGRRGVGPTCNESGGFMASIWIEGLSGRTSPNRSVDRTAFGCYSPVPKMDRILKLFPVFPATFLSTATPAFPRSAFDAAKRVTSCSLAAVLMTVAAAPAAVQAGSIPPVEGDAVHRQSAVGPLPTAFGHLPSQTAGASLAVPVSGPCDIIPLSPLMRWLCELFLKQDQGGGDIDWGQEFRDCRSAGYVVHFERLRDGDREWIKYTCAPPKSL